VRVPAEARLPGCRGFADVSKVLARTRYTVAWRALGVALFAYEAALAHARERVQFGKPIASFQLVQDKLARMLAEVTAMQLMCWRLSQLADDGRMTGAMASLAKMNHAAKARAVVADARDILGGAGILLENHVARHHADMEAVVHVRGHRLDPGADRRQRSDGHPGDRPAGRLTSAHRREEAGMLEGLMQHDHPLTLQHLLDRMRGLNSSAEVVTVEGEGLERATHGEVAERVDRLAGALASLGVGDGDRVATFAWNTQRHLEVYLAAPCMGAVLHTLNIRLFAEQLTYIVNHAKDKVILVDASLVPVLEKLAPSFETVEHYIVMGDGDCGSLPDALYYEELLAAQEPGYDYPALDDRAAAGLCYTSGTTGNPKGVLYSHRSSVLHAMAVCLADAMALSRDDRVLPVVPMFHANAWGLPYAAMLAGADLVLPKPVPAGRAARAA
jgi:hypothetical protein